MGSALPGIEHNFIVGKQDEELQTQGAVTAREQSFQLEAVGDEPPTTLKLDLVIKSRDRVFVVDVTVGLEYRDYLTAAHLEEQQKYAPLLPLVMRDFAATLDPSAACLAPPSPALRSSASGPRRLWLTLVALRTSIDKGRGNQLHV